MKLPTQFQGAARACYDGAVNRQLIARNIHEAIVYCQENNIALEADHCPPEITIMIAQLAYLLGLRDISLSDKYEEAMKELGYI